MKPRNKQGRSFILALLVLALAACTAGAATGKGGSYTGATSQGSRVKLTIAADGVTVRRKGLSIGRLSGSCTGGLSYHAAGGNAKSFKFKGLGFTYAEHFTGSTVGPNAGPSTLQAKGRLSRDRRTVHGSARYTHRGANGIRCQASASFTLHKR
ncbi:MAG: hypothetical protein E6G56_04175 [Actinobacteria bacterium]|nr:MAG: hypothetical protein E6G56_04175 [Actinomycetota bacterium]